ncbi:MAG: aminoglycoside phosphotransferase family protein [Oscillochloridaceae bacterium umkhey_bin13]
MSPGTPSADIVITLELVRGLLADQHPDLADLPLRLVDSGWDNQMVRLGDQLALRLPRRAVAAPLIVNEQTWLPHLAPRLPLPTPLPLHMGQPGRGYPWAWSVVPWLAGQTADVAPLAPGQAAVLGEFLRTLHQPAPAHAPRNPVRGCPLHTRQEAFRQRLANLGAHADLISPALLIEWEAALAAPLEHASTWIHGDLHPRNLLVVDGQLRGVIDWGDLARGDPATDLAAFWMLWDDRDERDAGLAAYGPLSAAMMQRARGWALHLGVTLLATGLHDHPRHAAIGVQTLQNLG